MALSPRISRFSIKGVAPYDRATGIPYGVAEVIGSGGLDLTGEMVSLQGGASRYPWNNAHGYVEPKMTINFKEFHNFLYQLCLGVTPTSKDATEGLIENFKNIGEGNTLANIYSGATIGDKANLKYGTYTGKITTTITTLAKGTSEEFDAGDKLYFDSTNDVLTKTSTNNEFRGYATEDAAMSANMAKVTSGELNVYASTDIDAQRGTVLTLFDDFLRINEDPIVIQDGTNVALEQIGVSLTALTSAGGFDLNAVTNGSTFSFDIIPPSTYYREVIIGKSSDTFPEFGMYMYAERGEGYSAMFIDAFKCKANGLPMNLTEKSWQESEISIMPVTDGARGVCRVVDII